MAKTRPDSMHDRRRTHDTFPTALQGVSASPHSEENLFVWTATILGPSESPWEGGMFNLRLTFDEHVRGPVLRAVITPAPGARPFDKPLLRVSQILPRPFPLDPSTQRNPPEYASSRRCSIQTARDADRRACAGWDPLTCQSHTTRQSPSSQQQVPVTGPIGATRADCGACVFRLISRSV